MPPVFVFGHRNPDTDAICAALAYADLLQKTRMPEAVAACCGAPNQRTEYALRCAGVNPPKIVMDVRPEVIDVCRRSDLITAHENEPFYQVYERVKSRGVRSLPVVDDNNTVVGIVSLIDLLEVVFHGDDEPLKSRIVKTTAQNICNVLQGEYQNADDVDAHKEMIVMVGAMSAQGFTKRLHRFPAEQLIVVSGDRPTIHLPALEHKVRMLVVTGGYSLSPGLVQLAQLNNVTVIKSPYDTATTTMRLKTARTIDTAIQRQFTHLSAMQSVADARQVVERIKQPVYPVLDDSGVLVGVLSATDLINPPKTKLILVDHNELGQAVQGADEAEILEVLDHHRLGGGLRSSQPIRFINEPVGSTCTLVARQFRASGVIPSPGIALCMASGIISDTLYLRSPTATDTDRDILEWLRQYCHCDLESYAREFFEIGSALRTCTPAQVVREDCKEFEEQGKRFSISQIEEIGFELFWNRKEEMLQALKELTEERNLEFSALLVTDIVSNGSLLLMSREPEYWQAINYPRVDRSLYQLDGVVSRKKQLLPLVAQLLETAYADSPVVSST